MKTNGYIYRPIGGVILHAYYYRNRLYRQWFIKAGLSNRELGVQLHLGAWVSGCGIEFRRHPEGEA